MKVLLVVDGMHPRHGGPPPVVAGSASALAALGHDITVLTTVLPSDEDDVKTTWKKMLNSGVKLVFCKPVGLWDLVFTSRQDAVFRDMVKYADVVHLHGIWNPVLLVVGRLAKLLKVPYLFSVHGVLDHRAMTRVRRKWIKKRVAISLFGIRDLLNRSSAVVFGSEAEAAQSWNVGLDLKMAFVPNGADESLATVEPDETTQQKFVALAPGQHNWGRTLLSFSRIHPEKGLDMLVNAFSQVAFDFPDAHLLIAGLRQDLAFERELQNSIDNSPVRHRIVMTTELTGPRSHFLYGRCDFFVLPSIAEGFSVALTEALANGKAVLVTKYCHMPIVAEFGAGVVVEPNVDGIASGLRALLALSDQELQEMGRKARLLFESRYTWERVGHSLVELYQAAIQSVPST